MSWKKNEFEMMDLSTEGKEKRESEIERLTIKTERKIENKKYLEKVGLKKAEREKSEKKLSYFRTTIAILIVVISCWLILVPYLFYTKDSTSIQNPNLLKLSLNHCRITVHSDPSLDSS